MDGNAPSVSDVCAATGRGGGLALSVAGLEVRGAGGRVLVALPELDMPAGTLLGIQGPSGAGKSTLLHVLAGLLPARGTIRWGDTDIAALGAERAARFRAEKIGMIFQDFLLFEELDAEGNAALAALFRPRRERARLRAAARARLDALGLGGIAARRVASLSGGERQRVAVARAMAAEAPVLLADEPTASLDRPSADRLVDDLVRLARDTGATLVAASHDPRLIGRMDRVLTLADGTVAAARRAAA